jgi:predicted transposase YbfD/YdcC
LLLLHAVPALSSGPRDDDVSGMLEMLGKVADPRKTRGRRHKLVLVLAVALVAVLAGAANFRQIGSQAADLPQDLLRRLGAKRCFFKRGYPAPSEATIRRVLQKIDPAELDLAVGAWLFERARRDRDDVLVIALDGKVMRGAWTDDNGKFTLFSAMIHREGVPVGQVAVPADTTEVTQVEALLETIPVEPGNTVATVDAAHTGRDTAEELVGRGVDYVMTVKGNTPTLQEAVFERCLPLLKTPGHVVEERGHGRIKRWETWVTLADGIDFPHVEQLACIRRDVFDLDGVRVGKEFALVVTSVSAERAGAAEIHTYVREHWGIENKEHYVRDTTWEEDANQSYVGNGQHSMAALRNLALGLFRLNGIHKIKEATEKVCRDRSRALPLLAT